VTTDRLVFHALDATSGAVVDAPLPLDQVPAMAFSETLCDLETAIDATSVAAVRFWTDRGAGVLAQDDRIEDPTILSQLAV
jgi:hypothetical protein